VTIRCYLYSKAAGESRRLFFKSLHRPGKCRNDRPRFRPRRQDTALFREVKLNRGPPDGDGVAGRLRSACRSPYSPKVLVSRSVFIRPGVLAPFHPPFTEWSLLISGVVPFRFGTMGENIELLIQIQHQVIQCRRLANEISDPEPRVGFMNWPMRLSGVRAK
jgi:hypothetical protein